MKELEGAMHALGRIREKKESIEQNLRVTVEENKQQNMLLGQLK